jgi:Fic family protein
MHFSPFQTLDVFDGKLTSSKWASIAKCTQATALCDISDLLVRGVLVKSTASSRSTSYELATWHKKRSEG